MNDIRLEYLKAFYDEDKLLYYKEQNEDMFDCLYKETLPQKRKIKDINDRSCKWFVESPDGYVPVKSLINKGEHEILTVKFEDGTEVNTSPLHMFERIDGEWISTINLKVGDGIISDAGIKRVAFIEDAERIEDIYDLAVNHENHRYYTNGLSSHNSGAGKSLFLQNQALNWAELGLNVIYITLELSQDLTSMRIDAMTSGYSTKEIMKNIDDVDFKVKKFKSDHDGSLQIKQLPNGSTANDIRAYIKEYEIQTGIKIDAVLVDYLDLCSPIDRRINPSDLFVKDKYVSEELRTIAVEQNIIMVTASQLNRGSHDEIEFSHSHIAGGISKINTADNVIGIFTTISMKDSGRYQVQLMKTRSSAGVGSKIDLSFNKSSLRIRDLEEGETDATTATATNILENLKKKNVVTEKGDSETKSSNPASSALKKSKALRDLVKRSNI